MFFFFINIKRNYTIALSRKTLCNADFNKTLKQIKYKSNQIYICLYLITIYFIKSNSPLNSRWRLTSSPKIYKRRIKTKYAQKIPAFKPSNDKF